VLLDTGLRLGEALSLDWAQVRLDPAQGARFGFLTVLSGKAKNNKSLNVPLSARVVGVLKRWEPSRGGLIFRRADGKALQASLMGAQQGRVRVLLKLPADFVLHSLRHTFGTRLGEAGADAFTIMRLMGHSNVTVSQRYVHPSPEAVELAFERLTVLNMQKVVLESGIPKKPESLELQ
jgi:integrase